MTDSSFDPIPSLVADLGIAKDQIVSVLALLQEGNTIPFIARYRKERIGNLDEVQVRNIKERWEYVQEMEDRRQTILKSIESQGKLTDELKKQILACENKNQLEDLYLPYKPKRRTRAMIAKEKGLEPLSQWIVEQRLDGDPLSEAEKYIDAEKGVETADDALKGARDIVAEVVAERADVRAYVRDIFETEGVVVSEAKKEWVDKPSKFEQYYQFSEKVSTIPSHRYLAIRRGEKEDVLRMHIAVETDLLCEEILKIVELNPQSPWAGQLQLAVDDSYKRLIESSVETDVCVDLKMRADREAVEIFAQNLRTILLAAPLGSKSVIGVDPGLRTGCKCAAIKDTSAFVDTMTFHLTQGANALERARLSFLAFVEKHQPYAIAIGNGTASRETEAFVREVLKAAGKKDIIVIQVSESGASVYSASEVAREEFPDIDLTIRGAISIGRRLQDPLAELVKVEPKALGVGQYQHDVYQTLLENKLHEVVESCVNHVGVDLNTASAPLLSYVAGVGPSLAKKIVEHREKEGPFTSREQLKKVSGLGPRTFLQAAGFCRIRNGAHPLDASAVHPESYGIVERMAADQGTSLAELVGNASAAGSIDIKPYVTEEVGAFTLKDILDELKKPGRDPRAIFEMPKFREDVTSIEDLRDGMVLEGIVTNVTAFGAFVDVGVHQDGLVHISQLSDRFIKDPSEVVKAGDKLQVQVLEVDVPRKRISMTALIGKAAPSGGKKPQQPRNERKPGTRAPKAKQSFGHNPFASL